MTAPSRLSALDAAFVALDGRGAPFVVGSVLVFDRFDVGRFRAYMRAIDDRLPRYLQRIQHVPVLGHPVWVDDPAMDFDEHVRSARLPAPGSARQFNEFLGHLFAKKLPMDRPPWQLWVVEGLEGDAVALVGKAHHSLVDGIAGVNLMQVMFRGVPDSTIPERQPPKMEVPSRWALLRDELLYRARGIAALRKRLRDVRELTPALGALLMRGLSRATDVGMNPKKVGPDRLISGWTVPMKDIIQLKRRYKVKVNDIVLAISCGALRSFLIRRGVDVARVKEFRVMIPVSTHDPSARSVSGNRVVQLLVPLPIGESEPRRRVEKVAAATGESKGGAQQAAAGDLLVQVSDVTAPSLLAGVLGLSCDLRGFNVLVTNIPGPPFPLYLLGAKLRSYRPIVNLWPGQALGIALLSYNGTLHWGLQSDPKVIPDLESFVEDLKQSFAALVGEELPAPLRTPEPTPPGPSASAPAASAPRAAGTRASDARPATPPAPAPRA
jgi:diacylglycerol O-acyltransferase / wax synthase